MPLTKVQPPHGLLFLMSLEKLLHIIRSNSNNTIHNQGWYSVHVDTVERLIKCIRWLEHDPFELLDSVQICIEHAVRKLALMGLDATNIEAVGITNQRETVITWDSLTGQPLYPAIVWSDARTVETVDSLSKKKGVDALRDVCGLPLTTYFSAVKLRWLLDNVPVVQQAESENRLCAGTVDSWLLYVSFLFSFLCNDQQ